MRVPNFRPFFFYTLIVRFPFTPNSTIFNAIIPIAVKIIMMFERHQTEGGYQSSLYLKITIFRWVNTAIALQVR